MEVIAQVEIIIRSMLTSSTLDRSCHASEVFGAGRRNDGSDKHWVVQEEEYANTRMEMFQAKHCATSIDATST